MQSNLFRNCHLNSLRILAICVGENLLFLILQFLKLEIILLNCTNFGGAYTSYYLKHKGEKRGYGERTLIESKELDLSKVPAWLRSDGKFGIPISSWTDEKKMEELRETTGISLTPISFFSADEDGTATKVEAQKD